MDYSHEDADRYKAAFVSGIGECIIAIRTGELPLKGGIGEAQLKYMLDFVEREDLSKRDGVVRAYKEYAKITGKSSEDSLPEWRR